MRALAQRGEPEAPAADAARRVGRGELRRPDGQHAGARASKRGRERARERGSEGGSGVCSRDSMGILSGGSVGRIIQYSFSTPWAATESVPVNAIIGTVNMQFCTILFGFSVPVCVPQSLHCTALHRSAVLCCSALRCAALRWVLLCCAAAPCCAALPVCFVACLFACLSFCFRSKGRISHSAARRCARIKYSEYPGQSPRLHGVRLWQVAYRYDCLATTLEMLFKDVPPIPAPPRFSHLFSCPAHSTPPPPLRLAVPAVPSLSPQVHVSLPPV